MWEARDERLYSYPRTQPMEGGKPNRYLWIKYRKSQSHKGEGLID